MCEAEASAPSLPVWCVLWRDEHGVDGRVCLRGDHGGVLSDGVGEVEEENKNIKTHPIG